MKGTGESTEAAAAFWFARLRSDSAGRSDRARFVRWLNEDEAHREAYAEYESFWIAIGCAAADPAIVAMRREALSAAPDRSGLHWTAIGSIAATLLLAFLAASFLLRSPVVTPSPVEPDVQLASRSSDLNRIQTAVGQRSAVTLDDGSVVELNTDSLIDVNYGERLRQVRLVRGQALFEVAHDSTRPFVVEAAGQRIIAIGTAFDVRVGPEGMQVTLVEGKVAVEPVAKAETPAKRRMLAPGEQLVARADRPVVVLAANVGETVSWRTGRLIFTDDPLGQVVDEINRYSTRKVVLSDPTLADLRVSGVFRAGSIDNFATAMEAAFPVAAKPGEGGIQLSWK